MKNPLFTLFLGLCSLFFAPCSVQAQTIPPPYINYQAVLYDVNSTTPNAVLADTSLTTFVNIQDELGNLLYREEHFASTDANGLITVKMGDGVYTAGTITNFNQINWSVGKYYLVVDFHIGASISSTAPEQLVTVPYSFYAGNAGNGMTGVSDNGNGTLTFTYANGSTYTTPTLAGIQGPTGATGPQGPAGAQGANGQSAYELWLAQGNTGTAQDFLTTSAYQIWLAQGNTGSQQTFLNTLVGPAGATGTQGPQGVQGPAGTNGTPGTQGPIGLTGPQGPTGNDGAPGIQGPTGATGPQGPTGVQGANGQSAYELWLAQGNTGTAQDFLTTSAYQIWLAQGNAGSQQTFLNTLVGPAGAPGTQGPIGLTGPQGPQGVQGTAGTNGLNALINTTTEPAGANCANGGTKIETGLDANGNGVLETGEINATQTQYVCDNTGGAGGGLAFSNMQVFSTLGTYSWTCPVGVTKVLVELWGGGGSGSSYASGGCGGGYGKEIVSVVSGSNYTVVVGVGGLVGSNQDGGTSSFNTLFATGGSYANKNPSNGGVSNAQFNISGGRARPYEGGDAPNGGMGGYDTRPPQSPGGGGGSGTGNGSSGAPGRVVIWY